MVAVAQNRCRIKNVSKQVQAYWEDKEKGETLKKLEIEKQAEQERVAEKMRCEEELRNRKLNLVVTQFEMFVDIVSRWPPKGEEEEDAKFLDRLDLPEEFGCAVGPFGRR